VRTDLNERTFGRKNERGAMLVFSFSAPGWRGGNVHLPRLSASGCERTVLWMEGTHHTKKCLPGNGGSKRNETKGKGREEERSALGKDNGE